MTIFSLVRDGLRASSSPGSLFYHVKSVEGYETIVLLILFTHIFTSKIRVIVSIYGVIFTWLWLGLKLVLCALSRCMSASST